MTDEILVDMLATAVVHFDVQASPGDARRTASDALVQEVEDGDLLGDGELATVRMTEMGRDGGESTFEASAIVRFRVLVPQGNDPIAIARDRLRAEVEGSGLLTDGGVSSVVDD